jgi:hypothetical protein
VGDRTEDQSQDKSKRDDQACKVGEVCHRGDQRIEMRKKILALRGALACRRECGRQFKMGRKQRSELFCSSATTS